jgi:hypothetical protein
MIPGGVQSRIDNKKEDILMKRIMMTVAAGLLALGLAERPAAAATIYELGPISPGSTSGFVANLGTNITSFDDVIKFSLSSLQSSLTGSLSDITSLPPFVVNTLTFSLDLFAGSDPSNPGASLGHFSDLTGTGLAFNYLNLAAGDYFFEVTGATGGKGTDGNAFSYKFEVSEVPVPPALLLFATALGGMALFGYRRRTTQV